MSLKPEPITPIPEEIVRIAQAAFPISITPRRSTILRRA